MSSPSPIRLRPADAGRYLALRRRMLAQTPWAFGASPEDDRALDPAFVASALAEEHNAIFAFEAGLAPAGAAAELVAAAGVVRQAKRKFVHRARVWGVFVEPAQRGKGLGAALLTAAVELARSWSGVDFVDLSVSASSPEAEKLYQRLGFRAWGKEPEALEHDGRRHDEIHMSLRLRSPGTLGTR